MKLRSRFSRLCHLPAAAALLVLLAVSGCAGGGSKTENIPCPETGLMLDAAQMTAFDPSDKAASENTVLTGRIDNYRGACRLRGDTLEFVLEIDFAARKGVAAAPKMDRAKLPYFVAILGPNEEVLQRQSFESTVTFAADGVGLSTESHNVLLPITDKKTVRQHKVVIGFELTPAQLAHNRGEVLKAPKPAEKKPAAKPSKKKKK